MTSWVQFLFHSAPWLWKILLTISFPIWMIRVMRIWRFAGGWMQRYGKRCAVGVKPSWLIEQADRSMGEQIFILDKNPDRKVQSIACHELTHAFTAHLKLPMWLNEGLAMVMVDRFLGTHSVKVETLWSLQNSRNKPSPSMYQRLSTRDKDALVYQYVRGYWITRFLQDTKPDLLKELLEKKCSHRELEQKVASAYAMSRLEFWEKIDGLLVDRFLTNRQTSI
jgi:hypothetical protein